MTSSVELASHQQEIDSIIECHQFLVGLKILKISPCTVSRRIKFKLFPDGESRPVVWVKALPKMDVISYPSLEDLMIHLMASVSFFYAGDDIVKKYRIHANMVIAIRNHRKISARDKLVSWAVKFFTEEFGDEASRAEPASTRCNVNMTVLRELAEVFGCPQLYVGTPVYDPSKLSLEVAKDIRPTCPLSNVESIRPRPSRPAAPTAGMSKSLSAWYASKNFERRDSGFVVTALVRRCRAMRSSGFWQRKKVKEPVPAMYAALENGGAMRVFEHRPQGRCLKSMASTDYYSLQALFVDIMGSVCTVLDSTWEFEKQCSLAAVLDCVITHWPVGDSKLAALWKEMATWLWRLARVDCLDLNDPQQTLTNLERCDKHLEEFQQRFVSRTSVGGPLNVWKKCYMPPGTVWRKMVMDELNRHSGTRKNVLIKFQELRTYHFVYPTPDSAAEQAIVEPSSSKKRTGRTELSVGEGVSAESTACPALPNTVGGFGENVFASAPNETHPISTAQNGTSRTRQRDTCEVGPHNDEHSRVQRRKNSAKENGEEERSKPNPSENTAAPPGDQSPIDKTRGGYVFKKKAVAEDVPRDVRVKSEAVDIIHVSSSSSASEDEREDESDDRRRESSRNGRSEVNSGVKVEARCGLVSGRKRSQPSEVQDQANAGESGAPACGDRKRRLDENLGCDYRERMRAVQVLLKRYRDHFPDHLDHFEVFDAHVRNLEELAAPKKFTKVVTKMLDEQCIENIERLFGGFLKKFAALVDPSVKEEMDTCREALSLVLNDSRMLVNFQAQFKKKQRRQ